MHIAAAGVRAFLSMLAIQQLQVLFDLLRVSPGLRLQLAPTQHGLARGDRTDLGAVDGHSGPANQALPARELYECSAHGNPGAARSCGGNRQSSCGPEPVGPSATCTPRCGGTHAPTRVKNTPNPGSPRCTASAGPPGHKGACPFFAAAPWRIPASPSPAADPRVDDSNEGVELDQLVKHQRKKCCLFSALSTSVPHPTSKQNARRLNVWRAFGADLRLDYLHSLFGRPFRCSVPIRTCTARAHSRRGAADR